MSREGSLRRLLGTARLRTYVDAAHGDPKLAADLYEWGTRLAGAWHSHISFVEIGVRNAIDRELISWNSSQRTTDGSPFPRDWTLDRRAAPLVSELIGKPLTEARKNAAKEARGRPRSHPRHLASVTHDDVVAQLTFGSWSRLVMPPQGNRHRQGNARQSDPWEQALHLAFPGAASGDEGRVAIGRQLEAIRRLRNRIAHHDNLLTVDTGARLNGSLSLLAAIDPEFPDLVMASNSLRALVAEDPRRTEGWSPPAHASGGASSVYRSVRRVDGSVSGVGAVV